MFGISLLNRNCEGAANLELVLLTQNSISLEALCVCVIVNLPQIFCLMQWEQLTTTTATNYPNSFQCQSLVTPSSSSSFSLVPVRSRWFQIVPTPSWFQYVRRKLLFVKAMCQSTVSEQRRLSFRNQMPEGFFQRCNDRESNEALRICRE